jgi:hypothetical protein
MTAAIATPPNPKRLAFAAVVLAVAIHSSGDTSGASRSPPNRALDASAASILAMPSRTYYVAASGSDARSGRSKKGAWQTVERVNSARLHGGDRLLFRAGDRWTGQLQVTASGVAGRPILFGSYGRGREPTFLPRGNPRCIVVSGDYVVLRRLKVARCLHGISIFGDHVRLERAHAFENAVGVRLESESDAAVVARNRFTRNNRMVVNTEDVSGDDWGAIAILVAGTRANVHHNIIVGSVAQSHDYDRDGAAIEIFGGRHNRFHHNLARDNTTFTELGNDDSVDNAYYHNVVRATIPGASFLNIHGIGQPFGPVYGTSAYHNSVYLSGKSSSGVWCKGCAPNVLSLRNNAMKVTGGYFWVGADEAHDVVDGDYVHGTLGRGSRRADPLFVSKDVLRLRRRSPAIDAGIDVGARVDFRGVSIPQGAGPDVGAFESTRSK